MIQFFFLKNGDDDRSIEFPDDSFLMVSQLHWEDDVVWDGNDIKHKVREKVFSSFQTF